ncbi:MAG: hypothetical protein ACLGID_02220 [Gammaproteobacteria bacterium]
MKIVNFLCADAQSTDLAEFVQRVFEALGVMDGAERVSSNYLDDKYFIGQVNGGQLTAALSDEVGFDDLPYWLSFETEGGDEVIEQMAALVKNLLPPLGVDIARIESFGKKDMRIVD